MTASSGFFYHQLNWSQYRTLIGIADSHKREYYERHEEHFRDSRNILASQYSLYLPSESQLLAELRKELDEKQGEMEGEYMNGMMKCRRLEREFAKWLVGVN